MTTTVALVAVAVVAVAVGLVAGRVRCAARLAAVLIRGDRPAPVPFAELLGAVRRLRDDADTAARGAETASARLGSVLEGFTDAVLLVDPHGEVRAGHAAGRRIQAARHGDALVLAAVWELLGTVATSQETTATADRRVELAGRPRRVLDIVIRRLPDGDRLVTVEDISERRRLEDVRRDFVANISHELKTPIGALSLLAETMSAEDDPELTGRLAQRIHQEALRVSAAIDDLLLLSRIEGDRDIVAEDVVLDAVVTEAVERVAQAAAASTISIRCELHSPPLEVDGDRRQLVSATFNLLENAVKYSDGGSVVVVRTALSGDDALVEVEDRGIGIPAKELERVFERFYRVDRARSRLTGGTGLGLAIVRHVVQNHRGTVRVRSREGEGSTFTLVLPGVRLGRLPAPARAVNTGPSSRGDVG